MAAGVDCIVYLGPSLPLSEAQKVLPDAMYLPPVRCMDVLRALRLQPRVIAIIDGVYESVGSVWHKELLIALERGVKVIGGASMGALRAAEMAGLGMEGVGSIFADYLSGDLRDDDEVAVLQSAEGSPLTDAMVNIRATVERAVREAVLPERLGESVMVEAKECFFQERRLDSVVRALGERLSEADQAALNHFTAWFRAGGFVNLKESDARATLERARELAESATALPEPFAVAPRTIFVRHLWDLARCKPFICYHPSLPLEEKVALAARFLGSAYKDVKLLAAFLQATHRITGAVPGIVGTESGWLDDLEAEHSALIDELPHAEEYVAHILRLDSAFEGLRRDGETPVRVLESSDPERFDRLLLIARLWRLVEAGAVSEGLTLSHDALQELAEALRQRHKLIGDAEMLEWLRANGLSVLDMQQLLMSWGLLLFAWSQSSAQDAAATRPEEDRWWFREALVLSGVHAQAQAVLDASPAHMESLMSLPGDDEEADGRDFQWGLVSVNVELKAMQADQTS